MIISIIQPCFVPWLGYFEQIAVADIFVYMDDVKYTKQDWRNNNQVKSPNGISKIFVPVKKTTEQTLINQALISYSEKWEQKLINQLTSWYIKAPYFPEILEIIRRVIFNKYEKLVDLNYYLNKAILKYIGIDTPIYFSSDIKKATEDKNKRLIEICKHFGGISILYDGKKAQDFIDLQLFKSHNIEMIFQNYQHTPYPQLWGDFESHMSVIDVLMNCGKDSKNIILSNPLPDKLKLNEEMSFN